MTQQFETKPRRLTLPVLVCLVQLLVSCNVATAPISGSPLGAERTIADTGITLSPPGSLTPTVSADRAYGLCRTHVADCDSGDPTAVELALMTDTGSNIVAPNTLVWVFSWLGSSGCFFSGGGPVETRSGAPTTPNPTITPKPTCDKVAFIDARTATFYFTSEVGHP